MMACTRDDVGAEVSRIVDTYQREIEFAWFARELEDPAVLVLVLDAETVIAAMPRVAALAVIDPIVRKHRDEPACRQLLRPAGVRAAWVIIATRELVSSLRIQRVTLARGGAA